MPIVATTSGSAASLFRLKSEREWDEEQTLFVNNDLFSLDLRALEAAVGTIPLHSQIELREGEVGVSTNCM